MITAWVTAGLFASLIFLIWNTVIRMGHMAIVLIVGCFGAVVGGLIYIAITPFSLGDLSFIGIACALFSSGILLFGYHEMSV